MIIDFSTYTINDYAAWWGAIIATLALVWNIIVAIRSGARIKVHAYPGMSILSSPAYREDKTFISVTAVNHGTSPTTITHFCGFYSTSLWNLIRGKKQQFIINASGPLGNPVPYVLQPGEEWRNLADEEEFMKHDGAYIYLGVVHNQRTKPVYSRVKIKKQ